MTGTTERGVGAAGPALLRVAAIVLTLLGGLCLGCASVPPPGTLYDESTAALKNRDYETCYLRAKDIRDKHPRSSEVERAFALAAQCHSRLFGVYRYLDRGEPDGGRWRGEELLFMFDWLLAQYFEGAQSFPDEGVNTFFPGYPFAVFTEFGTYAGARPEVARWDLRAHTDNGMIEHVRSGGVGKRLDGTATWRN